MKGYLGKEHGTCLKVVSAYSYKHPEAKRHCHHIEVLDTASPFLSGSYVVHTEDFSHLGLKHTQAYAAGNAFKICGCVHDPLILGLLCRVPSFPSTIL